MEIAKNRMAKSEKQYATTKSVRDQATQLNFKKIDIIVNNGLVKEGGIFSASYLTYNITTSGDGFTWEVRRKDADFFFLRKFLLKCFPHTIIPPCPRE